MSAMPVVSKRAPALDCIVCTRKTPSTFLASGGKRRRKTCSAACFSERRSQLNREAMTPERARNMAMKKHEQKPDQRVRPSLTGKNSTEERRQRGLEQLARKQQEQVERRIARVQLAKKVVHRDVVGEIGERLSRRTVWDR